MEDAALLDSPQGTQATVVQTMGETYRGCWQRAGGCSWRAEVGQPLPGQETRQHVDKRSIYTLGRA
eukprot:266401-Pyramimonas_sp.AAC.1